MNCFRIHVLSEHRQWNILGELRELTFWARGLKLRSAWAGKNVPWAADYVKNEAVCCCLKRQAIWSTYQVRYDLISLFQQLVWAMVFGCGFDSRVHLKTRCIRWSTRRQKNNDNIIGSQKGKKILNNFHLKDFKMVKSQKIYFDKANREKTWQINCITHNFMALTDPD